MNGFAARSRAAESAYESDARELHEQFRPSGGKFWGELSQGERDSWLRIARHVAERIDAAEIRAMNEAEMGDDL